MRYELSERAQADTAPIRGVLWVVLLLWLGGGNGYAQQGDRTGPEGPEEPPRFSVAAARATEPGIGTPRRVGDTLRVQGRATVGTGGLPDSTLIFLQDETAGIAVQLPAGPEVQRGDSLWVEGVVQHQYGLTRLRGLHYGQVDALVRAPAPAPLTVSGAAGEGYEGQLIQVRGRVVANRTNDGGQYLLLTDPIPHATARIAVFVPRRRLPDLSLQGIDPGDEVRITGLLSQHDRTAPYTAEYQVLPRDRDDLEPQADGMGYKTLILVIVGGALLAALVVLTLRSAVRRRTQQLAESRARFRRLAEATREGIILHQDGDILDANRALTEMLGRSRSELLNRSVEEVVSTSLEGLDLSSFQDATGGPREAIVHPNGGEPFPAEVEERVVQAADPPVRVAALRDITERKEHERELLAAKEEAEEMARLKSSLLNNMSHEFRTPITSILGYAEIILEEPEANHQPFARHIQRSGTRLSRTLRAVLEMAQMEAGTITVDPSGGDVGAAVRAEVDTYRALAEEKDIALTVTAPEPAPVQTDLQLLRRIVGHLVHNAIKFTKEGRVDVSVEVEAKQVSLRVSDSGPGIDPAVEDRLFEPFKQASEGRTRTHEGMGLGLALTKRMVTLLDGTVDVQSDPGRGSTFIVQLPSRVGEDSAPAVTESPDDAP
jgi:PAS domain S-box-containing protein